MEKEKRIIKKEKKFCSTCGKPFNKLYGKLYDKKCFKCHRKTKIILNNFGTPRISLETALERTYMVKGYGRNQGVLFAVINVPSILAFKKVKLVLVN